MKRTDWIRRFEASCRRWQTALGLTDWAIRYSVRAARDDTQALVDYDENSREATVTAFTGEIVRDLPHRVACHEMLHLALADVMNLAAARGSAEHPDVAREEHRLIERLVSVLEGRL